jgi:ABC-type hemin transport system substrate-binding protein
VLYYSSWKPFKAKQVHAQYSLKLWWVGASPLVVARHHVLNVLTKLGERAKVAGQNMSANRL